jgi:hypothetical protein
MTLETVGEETPASRATAASVGLPEPWTIDTMTPVLSKYFDSKESRLVCLVRQVYLAQMSQGFQIRP